MISQNANFMEDHINTQRVFIMKSNGSTVWSPKRDLYKVWKSKIHRKGKGIEAAGTF